MSEQNSPRPVDTDRNLLFGVLAMQLELIDMRQFADACAGWANHKGTPLAELLVANGWITQADQADVEALLQRKLKKHQGDVHASLAAATPPEVREALTGCGDEDIHRSLVGLSERAGHVLLSTIAYQPEGRERYTITRLHAKGGIGQVWLARDHDLGREVALKELKPERLGEQDIQARFLEEARITGQLEHPSIVPVYELVRPDKDSQPFYTMRFVRGRTLREASKAYHRKRQEGRVGPLDLRELLGAFVGVCNAVAYAHSRGVIHRDLKGQNVVVGDFGEVIVLDWGLAKLLHKAEGPAAPVVPAQEQAQTETVQGLVIGTPGYMSPEQAEGRNDRIDQRSDVYGLGAILYEILTGEPPFSGTETHEVLRQVLREPPVTPRSQVPGTPAALQAVCLRALAKDPAARYPTAGAVADEIRHYLADEPVAVFREPLPTRLARWGRRHKPLVAGAAALLVTAVVGLTIGTVLLDRANRETEEQRAEAVRQEAEARQQRDLATANFRKARQAVDDYFVQVSENKLLQSPLPGLQPLRKDLLETALKYYQAFGEQHREDPALQAELARAFYRVSQITSDIGSKAAALKVCQKARDLWEKLARDDPGNLAWQGELAKAWKEIGGLQYHDLGQRAEGLKALQRAQALWEPLVRKDSQNRDFWSGLAACYGALASWYTDNHQPDRGLAFREKSLTLWERLAAVDPKHRSDVAATSISIGNHYTRWGKPADALRHLDKARQILEQLVRENPGDLQARMELRRCYTDIGFLHHLQTRRFTEAFRFYLLAFKEAERLARDNPSVTSYQYRFAIDHNQLAGLWAELGQLPAAEQLLRKALPILEKLHAADPKNLPVKAWLANTYSDLSRMVLDPRRPNPALAFLEKALDLLKEVVAADRDNRDYLGYLSRAYRMKAIIHRVRKQPDEALVFFKEALQVLEKVTHMKGAGPENRAELAFIYLDIGDLHRAAGRRDQATECFQKSFDIRLQLAQGNPASSRFQVRLAQTSALLGEMLLAAGKLAPARQCLQQGAEALEKNPQPMVSDLLTRAEVYALLSATAGAGKTTLTAAEQAERDRQARQALASLEKLVAAQGTRTVTLLKNNPHLKPLGSRADYKKLLRDLEERVQVEREEMKRYNRAATLVVKGDHASAVKEAEVTAGSKKASAIGLYNAACIFSLASAAVGKDDQLEAVERDRFAGRYAQRAVDVLRQAAHKGYRDVRHMKVDKDLDPLRERADFKKLLADLEMAAK
jgi:eukaryotic-like serine/threonine-protein kinase